MATETQVAISNSSGSSWDSWLDRIFGTAQRAVDFAKQNVDSGPGAAPGRNGVPKNAGLTPNNDSLLGLAVIAVLIWALAQ